MQIPTGGLNSLIDPYDPSTADSKSSRAPVRKDTCQDRGPQGDRLSVNKGNARLAVCNVAAWNSVLIGC